MITLPEQSLIEKLKDYDDEIFLPVKGYEEFYIVSNYGKIISLHKRHYLKQVKLNVNYKGYLEFEARANGKRLHTFAHRFVAITFIENPNDLQQVNHIDCNKINNHVSNLEWVNAHQNIDHALKNNLMIAHKGSKCGASSLDESQVKEIKNEFKKGVYRGQLVHLSKKYNVTKSCLIYIKKGTTWKHIHAD